MANERPDRTVHDAIEAHETKPALKANTVDDGYRKVLERVPERIHEFLGPGNSAFGLTTDDYVNIDKRNYDSRVESGKRVLVSFGSRSTPIVKAIGTVRSETSSKTDDVTVEIGGHSVTTKGWNIKGVFE